MNSKVMNSPGDSKESNNGIHLRNIKDGGQGEKDELSPDIKTSEVTMERQIGFFGGYSFITGIIIGSGIFISPGGIASGAGSVGMSLVSWAICGIMASMGALTIIECGGLFPKSGGQYIYLKEMYGGGAAFLLVWTLMFVLKPAASALITLTCMLIHGVLMYSSELATRIQIVFNVAKIVALSIIVIGGLVMIGQGRTENFQNAFEGTNSNFGTIVLGFYSGMWAFAGWDQLNFLTEEIKDPEKNLPRCIIASMVTCTLFYILVNVSYFSVMSVNDVVSSSAVAFTWAERVIPSVVWIIPVSVALSTFGAANGSIYTGSRLNYRAALEGHSPNVLAMLQVKRSTPVMSLLFQLFLSILYVIPSNVGSLMTAVNFSAWGFTASIGAGLIYIRLRKPHLYKKGALKIPIIVHFFTFILATCLLVVPLVFNPKLDFLYVSIFMLSGFIFYFPLVYFKKKIPGFDHVTIFLQQFLDIVPPTTAI